MTAIAGYVSANSSQTTLQCDRILSGLARFGRGERALKCLDQACFGRILQAILPEDDYDRQPLTSPEAKYLLVADARIDNRPEIADRLGLPARAASVMSDADLICAAWERWKIRCLSYLLGDVALAVWDVQDRRLTLARSAVALKPLFYHRGRNFIAFASMPQGLHAVGEIVKAPNLDEIGAVAAGLPLMGGSACFAGINMVRHGHAMEIARGHETVTRTWDLDRIDPGSFRSADCAEALRAEMDRAVKTQLRRRGGLVATQLSSGRDSSAVTGTAARLLNDSRESLLALTGAPRLGFPEPLLNRLADESSLATETAKCHANITHVICRTKPHGVTSALHRLSRAHFGPMINMVGWHWSNEVYDEAAQRDASVMLIGSTGNFSISAGGTSHLRHVYLQEGLRAWWDVSRQLGGASWRDWRQIAKVSLGPLLPKSIYSSLLIMGNRGAALDCNLPILRAPHRERAEQLLSDFYSDPRPPKDYYSFRRKMLLKRDNAEKITQGLWGLDVRDPTGDRQLIELCLSFPADQLVSGVTARPAYEAAFSDRIPAAVLHNKRRGIQGADWFELFDREEVGELFRTYRGNGIISDFLDFNRINALLEQWPMDVKADQAKLPLFSNELLGALGIAAFIDEHFPR